MKEKPQGWFPNKDNIVGWGVYRDVPWHFAGIFQHKRQADERAAEMGDGCKVASGRQPIGTDDFIEEELPDA